MTRPRLLLVDDMPEIIEFCSDFLKPDYDIVGTAQNGEVAISAAAATAPDVILLNICMPRLNGLEVAKRLRSSGCRAVIVFFSAVFLGPGDETVTAALEAGGSACVAKPLAASDLRVAIREALAGRLFVSN